MITPDLLMFVKVSRGQGLSDEQIRAALKAQGGWNDDDINDVFASLPPQPVAPAPVSAPIAAPVSAEGTPATGMFSEQTPPVGFAPSTQSSVQPSLNPVTSAEPSSVLESQEGAVSFKPAPPVVEEVPAVVVAPRQKFKFPMKTVVAILIIIVVGVGVYIAYAYVYPMLTLSPQQILSDAFENSAQVKSAQYTLNGTVDFETAATTSPSMGTVAGGDEKFTLSLTGGSDISDPQNLKANLTANAALDSTGPFSLKTSASADVRLLAKDLYLRINKLPNLGVIDLSQLPIQNIWIYFPDAMKGVSTSSVTGASLSPTAFPVSPDSLLAGNKVPNNLTREKVLDVYKKYQVFHIDSFSNATLVDGSAGYHFDLSLDKAALEQAMTELITDAYGTSTSPKDITDMKKQMDAELAYLGPTTIKLDIGKSDKRIYSAQAATVITDSEEGSVMTLNATVEFKNYNQPIDVEKPSPVQMVDQISKLIMGSTGTMLPGTSTPIK